MSGFWKNSIDRIDVTHALLRAALAALLLMLYARQLMAFWQAAQIIDPGQLPNPALLVNAAIPGLFVLGAILLLLGFMTRFVAIALILLVAAATAFEVAIQWTPESVLAVLPRFNIVLGLLVPAKVGGGQLSVDGWIRSRPVIRLAE